MQIPEYRFVLLLRIILVKLGIICDIKEPVIVRQYYLIFIPGVNKAGVSVMRDAPDPGIK